MGLNLHTSTLALGHHCRFRPRSAAACALSSCTLHELQNNVQMTATCTGLEIAWERPSCKPKQAAPSAKPGATEQEVQGTQRPDAACLKDFRKVGSMSQDRSFVWKSHWAWVGWQVEWGEVSGHCQGGANSVNQGDGVSDMAPACSSLEGRPQKTMASVSSSVWEKAEPPALT